MTWGSLRRFLAREVLLGKVFRSRKNPRKQSGFAYVMAMIAVMTVLIMSQVALKNLVTQGRREAERDEIWRGNQYMRAVRLYYHKTGHYPTTVDDLKKGLPQLHFLRASAYKDPMNPEGDGAWGFIYVNSAGQLIGSSRYTSLQEMALLDLNNGQFPANPQAALGSLGIPAGAAGNGAPSPPGSAAGSTLGGPPQPPSGPQPPGTTTGLGDGSGPPAQPGQIGTPPSTPATPSSDSSENNALGQGQPTGPVDGPVLGAFLTGVVSKSKRNSLLVYKGGKKYSDWEFIWNPLEEQAQAVQSGLGSQTQTSPLGLPIANPNPGGAIVNPAGPANGPQPPAQTPPAQPPTSPSND